MASRETGSTRLLSPHRWFCYQTGREEEEISYALRRIQFDAYLLKKAMEGRRNRHTGMVTDVEIGKEKVTVYSGQNTSGADVVVGRIRT